MSEGLSEHRTPPAVIALLDHFRRTRPLLGSTKEYTSRALAAGALARAMSLLDGIGALLRAGHADLTGLQVRATFEAWVVGLYLVLGGDDALDHLTGAHTRSLRLLAERWPDGPGDATALEGMKEDHLNIEDVAKRVTALLAESGRHPGIVDASGLYNALYRSESSFDAHPTFGTFLRYLDDRGRRWELSELAEPLVAAERVEAMTGLYVAHLAWAVYDAFSISTAPVEALWESLLAFGTPLGGE